MMPGPAPAPPPAWTWPMQFRPMMFQQVPPIMRPPPPLPDDNRRARRGSGSGDGSGGGRDRRGYGEPSGGRGDGDRSKKRRGESSNSRGKRRRGNSRSSKTRGRSRRNVKCGKRKPSGGASNKSASVASNAAQPRKARTADERAQSASPSRGIDDVNAYTAKLQSIADEGKRFGLNQNTILVGLGLSKKRIRSLKNGARPR